MSEAAPAGPAEVLPARAYRGDLLELLQPLRRALKERGENLPAGWPDEASTALRSGGLLGWVLQRPTGERGIAVLATRERRGFGQVHLLEGPALAEDGVRLLEAVLHGLPAELERVDFTLTADPGETEEALGGLLDAAAPRLGLLCLTRRLMARPLTAADPPPARELPSGFRFVPALPLGAAVLSPVDFAAFQGGPDEGLVADQPSENERLLAGLLQGDLGEPLREGSPALVEKVPSGEAREGSVRLVGFALMLEESAHRALLADLALHPGYRRRGLGAALLVRALRGLVALGYTEARLWVTESNRPALALYEREGFRTVLKGRMLRWTRSPR